MFACVLQVCILGMTGICAVCFGYIFVRVCDCTNCIFNFGNYGCNGLEL